MKQKKSIFFTGGLLVALAGSFFLGGMASMGRAEVSAETAALAELNERSEKEIAAEGDGFAQACIEFAQNLLSDYPDCPLLDESAKEHWGDSSLENMVNDVNAGHTAKEAILAVCETGGLDAETAVISDLTKEQIMEIDRKVFIESDHPIGE